MSHSFSSKMALAFLVCAGAAGVPAAGADPIAVQSGGFYSDYGDPAMPWRFAGDGFSFEAAIVPELDDYWGPFASCFGGCNAGDPVDVSLRMFGFTGNGDSTLGWWAGGVTQPAEIHGVTYPVLFYTGDLNFSASAVPASKGWIEQPFVFIGHITAYRTPDFSGAPVFDWDLTGRGTAAALLGHVYYNEDTGFPSDRLGLQAVRYSFTDDAAPVPEPATLLLMGSALAGGLVRRLARRRS